MTAKRFVAAAVNGRPVRAVAPDQFYTAPASGGRVGLGLYCRATLDPGDVWWANDTTDTRFVARVIPWPEYLRMEPGERAEAERLCYVDPGVKALVICAEPFCRVNHAGAAANSACDADGNSVITRAVPPGEEITIPYAYEAVVSLVWKFPALRDAFTRDELADDAVMFGRATEHPAAARFLGDL